jgi:hypothetical protein
LARQTETPTLHTDGPVASSERGRQKGKWHRRQGHISLIYNTLFILSFQCTEFVSDVAAAAAAEIQYLTGKKREERLSAAYLHTYTVGSELRELTWQSIVPMYMCVLFCAQFAR